MQVQRITEKIKPIEDIYQVTTDYDTYADCEQALLNGIEAIKHNYSNNGYRRVKLRLSEDKKSLCYADIDASKSLFSRIRGERVIEFSSLRGFLFGAVSSTFARKRKQVVGAMSFQRSLILEEKSNYARAQLRRQSAPSHRPSNAGRQEETSYASYMAASDFQQDDIVRQQTLKLSTKDDMFYSWECVSLVQGSHTADFVIKDMRQMMCLLHVLQHRTMQEPVPGQKGCLRGLKVLKVKMKLSYECWRLQLRM